MCELKQRIGKNQISKKKRKIILWIRSQSVECVKCVIGYKLWSSDDENANWM